MLFTVGTTVVEDAGGHSVRLLSNAYLEMCARELSIDVNAHFDSEML